MNLQKIERIVEKQLARAELAEYVPFGDIEIGANFHIKGAPQATFQKISATKGKQYSTDGKMTPRELPADTPVKQTR